MIADETWSKFEAFVVVLRRRRRQLAVIQREVAAHVGVTQNCVTNWEAGRSRPSDDNLRAWASYLDVEVPEGVEGWTTPECGTPGGYRRHLSGQACEPCRKAWAAHYRARAAAR